MSAPAAPLPVSVADRAVLAKLAKSTAVPHREVIKAQVLLAAADGMANTVIAKRYGLTPVTVRTWRNTYTTGGVAALGTIASGRGRKRSIPDATIIEIVEKTHNTTPEGNTHWSVRTMAKEVGVSPATVQRVWSTLGCQMG